VIVFEEMARSGFTGPGFMIHCDLVATYVASFGSEAQKSAGCRGWCGLPIGCSDEPSRMPDRT